MTISRDTTKQYHECQIWFPHKYTANASSLRAGHRTAIERLQHLQRAPKIHAANSVTGSLVSNELVCSLTEETRTTVPRLMIKACARGAGLNHSAHRCTMTVTYFFLRKRPAMSHKNRSDDLLDHWLRHLIRGHSELVLAMILAAIAALSPCLAGALESRCAPPAQVQRTISNEYIELYVERGAARGRWNVNRYIRLAAGVFFHPGQSLNIGRRSSLANHRLLLLHAMTSPASAQCPGIRLFSRSKRRSFELGHRFSACVCVCVCVSVLPHYDWLHLTWRSNLTEFVVSKWYFSRYADDGFEAAIDSAAVWQLQRFKWNVKNVIVEYSLMHLAVMFSHTTSNGYMESTLHEITFTRGCNRFAQVLFQTGSSDNWSRPSLLRYSMTMRQRGKRPIPNFVHFFYFAVHQRYQS